MWAIKSFPAMLQYIDRNGRSDSLHRVELLGVLRINKDMALAFHREILVTNGYEVGDVKVIPFTEFKNKFKKYDLIKGG